MKKVLASSLAGVALAATLAACGSSSSTSSKQPAATLSMSTTAAAPANKNIVQTAVAAGDFKTLVSLVQQAGLAGALSGPGPRSPCSPQRTPRSPPSNGRRVRRRPQSDPG